MKEIRLNYRKEKSAENTDMKRFIWRLLLANIFTGHLLQAMDSANFPIAI